MYCMSGGIHYSVWTAVILYIDTSLSALNMNGAHLSKHLMAAELFD